jgi:hypothetical protein
MASENDSKSQGSFRVPNSIVQGLTTATPADLNRLTSFQMLTLFGLMAHVPLKHPDREVWIKVCDVLKILRVSRNVAHAVERCWTTSDGRERRKRYATRRYSPTHLRQVHEALLALYDQSVVLSSFDASGRTIKDRIVHILDSFGYSYAVKGRQLDLDDLPPDRGRVNLGTVDRPLWRVCRKTPDGERYDRPTAVAFRINKELAREILRCKGTIHFTLFAHRVFELFQAFVQSPAAIRLLVLVLRQTGSEFVRRLTLMLGDLGFDITHPHRAIEDLETVLDRLCHFNVVSGFWIDGDADRIRIAVNRTWYSEPGE